MTVFKLLSVIFCGGLNLLKGLWCEKMGSKENLISAQLVEVRAKGELIKRRVESKQA